MTDCTVQAEPPTSAEADAAVARHGYRRTNPGQEPAHYILDETLRDRPADDDS